MRKTPVPAVLFLAAAANACGPAHTPAAAPAVSSSPRVGPVHGSVVVVGGGAQGPEVFAKIIELAGGPDALIIDVPAAGGDTAYGQNWSGTRGLKAAGAKNVYVLHTNSRKVADLDSFVAPIKKAGGIWFEGGRQFHLVDLYSGTKTEKEFHEVLARGGVASGSSAGASILSSFMVRGAPSNNNFIMAYPGYEAGYGFIRGVTIDQHVVARERLPDLADSIMPKHPELLGMSEDEGTAWVVQGDVAEIIGRNKAFVYGGKDANDPGKPFLTLHPGDKYNLATRRVVHRAIDESSLTQAFIDGVFAQYATHATPGAPQATVLVAQNGKVFIDASYNVPPQTKYMPTTTLPQFALGGLSDGFLATLAVGTVRTGLNLDGPLADGSPVTVREFLSHQKIVPDGDRELTKLIAAKSNTRLSMLVNTRIYTPIGMHRTVVDSASGAFESDVDELYRWELGLTANRALTEADSGKINVFAPIGGARTGNALGWTVDEYRGMLRQAEYGTPDGKRNAFVRFPDKKAVVIILTNDASADARGMANTIADRLLFTKK